jgi:hypothetical protein
MAQLNSREKEDVSNSGWSNKLTANGWAGINPVYSPCLKVQRQRLGRGILKQFTFINDG